MYSVTFLSDNGKKYVFGKDGNTMFDMGLGDGVSIDIGTSQGFSQIGETVENQNVKGKTIPVHGVVYGDVYAKKNQMRNVFAPFVSGRLVFDGKYYIRVYVKDTPSFSTSKTRAKFSMRFFAPFPFFRTVSEQSTLIGGVTPMFKFPINYATPHWFGKKSSKRYTNIINSGDVKVPFALHITTIGRSSGITVTNLDTKQFLKFNGTLDAGDELDIYRDEHNQLRCEVNVNGEIDDAIALIDESSTLFELEVGDNQIGANDSQGGDSLVARFSFAPAITAVYEP